MVFILLMSYLKSPFFLQVIKRMFSLIFKKNVLMFAFHIWVFNPEVYFLGVVRGKDCFVIFSMDVIYEKVSSFLYWSVIPYLSNRRFYVFSFPLICLPSPMLRPYGVNYCNSQTNQESCGASAFPSHPDCWTAAWTTLGPYIFLLPHFKISHQIPHKTPMGVWLGWHWMCRIRMGRINLSIVWTPCTWTEHVSLILKLFSKKVASIWLIRFVSFLSL